MSGKKRGGGEGRTGRAARGGETAFQAAALCSPGVKAANARFTCKCLDCETDITHLESRGESQRIPGRSGGTREDWAGKAGAFSQLRRKDWILHFSINDEPCKDTIQFSHQLTLERLWLMLHSQ